MNKFGQWILNLLVGLFAFLFFLVLLFPLESMIRQSITKLEMQNKGKYRIEIKKISPSLFFKSKFEDITVTEKTSSGDKVVLKLKELRLGVKYFALLTQKVVASFESSDSTGKMSGDFVVSPEGYDVRAELANINLQNFPILFGGSPFVDLKGAIDGKIDLQIDKTRSNRNNGSVSLILKNILIPESRLAPMPGFNIDIPDLILSDEKGGKVRFLIEDGKVDVAEISLPGPDLSLNLKGKIQMNNKWGLSRITLDGDFNFSEKLSTAFPIVVMIDKEKSESGVYPLAISGRFSKPKIKIGTKEIL